MTQREGRNFPLDNEKWGNLAWAELLIPGVKQSSKKDGGRVFTSF